MNRTKIEWVKNPDGSQGYTVVPAYIAGFFDGEGCAMILTIRRRVNDCTFYRFRPVIKIQQKTEAVLIQIMNTLGCGHIDKTRTGFSYIINGLNGVLHFYQQIAPYSIVKHDSLVAVAAIAYLQKNKHRKNNPYPRQLFEKLLELREVVFKANRKTRAGLKQKYPRELILAEHHFIDNIDTWQKNRMRGIHHEQN